MSLVTIGIPFYNNEKTLSYVIKSVLAQTYSDLEIILMDDGSRDNSLEIARRFAQYDPRIKIISDGSNRGLIVRLNQIIDVATGEYLARMDADDMMDPIRIERQVRFLSQNPDVEVVTTGMASLDNNLHPVGKRCCQKTEPVILDVFRSGEDLLHASMLVRTTWAKKNKYFTGFDRAEDRELFTRTLGSSRYKIIPEPLYYYVDIQNMSLEKYLMSYKSERKAILKNWKQKISFFQMVMLITRSFLKSIVIRLYFFVGKEERIFGKKNSILSQSELQKINSDIRNFTA